MAGARGCRLMMAVLSLTVTMLAGCEGPTGSSQTQTRPPVESVACTGLPANLPITGPVASAGIKAASVPARGVPGCSGVIRVSCPPLAPSSPATQSRTTITATLYLDNDPLEGATVSTDAKRTVIDGERLTFTIPLATKAGPHQLALRCTNGGPESRIGFTVLAESATVDKTQARPGDVLRLTVSNFQCRRAADESWRPVIVTWENRTSPAASVTAKKDYDSLSAAVRVPDDASGPLRLRVRCEFDKAGSWRAETGQVRVTPPTPPTRSASPPLGDSAPGGNPTVTADPDPAIYGLPVVLTVEGLSCQDGSVIVKVDGAVVGTMKVPDATKHQYTLTPQRLGRSKVELECRRPARTLTIALTVVAPAATLSVRPNSGQVGTEIQVDVSGVNCGGRLLELLFDNQTLAGSTAGVNDVRQRYSFKTKVPAVPDGPHQAGIRCQGTAPMLGQPQAFTVKSQPRFTVDKADALPGTALVLVIEGFNCVRQGSPPEVIKLWDNELLNASRVPEDAAPGQHAITAQCDWPGDLDDQHRITRQIWVPGITTASESGAPGTNEAVALAGFHCPTAVVYFNKEAVATVTLAGDGTGSASFLLGSLPPGQYPIEAACSETSPRPVRMFTLLGAPDPANTDIAQPGGGGSLWPSALGILLALLVAGVIGLIRASRSKPHVPVILVQLKIDPPRLLIRERDGRP